MKRLLTLAGVLAISGLVVLAQGVRSTEHWVGAWSTAVVVATPVAPPAAGRGAPPAAPGQPTANRASPTGSCAGRAAACTQLQ